MAKKVFKRVDTTKLSARPPDPYGARFMKFMRGTAFELHQDQQKEAQLDVEKIKEELVAELKKSLAEMIRKAFMKKGSGGKNGQGMKISLANFKEQKSETEQEPEAAKAVTTGDVNSAVPDNAELKAETPAPAKAPSLDELATSQISLYSQEGVEAN